MARARKPGLELLRAFDDVRFGEANILNLRESLPSAADASRRAEQWLRQKQVESVAEVLVVTGRGNNSEGGVSPVREAVARLVSLLRRRNVIDHFEEHTPGSFSIRLASINSMVNAPRRRRDPSAKPEPPGPSKEIGPANRRLLRDIAERSLEGLGIKQTTEFLDAEMDKQFRAISAAVGPGPNREARLRAALRAALDQLP